MEGWGREKKGEEESRGGGKAQTAASDLVGATEEIGSVFREQQARERRVSGGGRGGREERGGGIEGRVSSG